MDRSDNDCTSVLWNMGKAHRVWNRLGNPRVFTMFYPEVVQSDLLYGTETWVWSEATSREIDGVHVGFLRRIKRQRAA